MNPQEQQLSQELDTIIRQYQELGRLLPQQQMNLDAANTGMPKFALGLEIGGKAGKDLARAFTDAMAAMYRGEKGMKAYHSSIDSLTNAVMVLTGAVALLGGPFTLLAAGLTAAVAGVAKYTKATTEMSDQLYDAFQQMSRAGGAASDGLQGLYDDVQRLGGGMQDLGDFVQLVSANAGDLASFGGSVLRGRQEFAKLGQEMEPFRAQLMNAGMTQKEINEATAGYIRLQSRLGATQNRTTADLAQSAKKYLVEQDALTKLIGMSRKEQEEAREAARNQEVFAAKLLEMRGQGQDEAANQLENTFLILNKHSKELGQGFLDISSGNLRTESAQKLFRATQGEAMRVQEELSAGQITAVQAADRLRESLKGTVDVFGATQGKLGNFGAYAGDLAGTIGFVNAGMHGYEKTLTGLQQDQAAQGVTGKKAADEELQRQTDMRLTQVKSMQNMQDFVRMGVDPATKAVSTFGKVVESVTDMLPGSGKFKKAREQEQAEATAVQAKETKVAESQQQLRLAQEKLAAAEAAVKSSSQQNKEAADTAVATAKKEMQAAQERVNTARSEREAVKTEIQDRRSGRAAERAASDDYGATAMQGTPMQPPEKPPAAAAAPKIPPRPMVVGRPSQKVLDWDKQYGATHHPDGSPKTDSKKTEPGQAPAAAPPVSAPAAVKVPVPDLATADVSPGTDTGLARAADFIRQKETGGRGPELKAFRDADRFSIGYGHRITAKEVQDRRIDLGDDQAVEVKGDMGELTQLTPEQAQKLFEKDLKDRGEKVVRRRLGDEHFDKLSANQKAALISLAYNGGPAAISTKLVLAIRNLDYLDAAEIIKSGPVTEKGTGKVLPGLVSRRAEESALFAGTTAAPDLTAAAKPEAAKPEAAKPEATQKTTTPQKAQAILQGFTDEDYEKHPSYAKYYQPRSKTLQSQESARQVAKARIQAEISKAYPGQVVTPSMISQTQQPDTPAEVKPAAVTPAAVKPEPAAKPAAVKPEPAAKSAAVKPEPAAKPAVVTPAAVKPEPAAKSAAVKPEPAVKPAAVTPAAVKPEPAAKPEPVTATPTTPAAPKPPDSARDKKGYDSSMLRDSFGQVVRTGTGEAVQVAQADTAPAQALPPAKTKVEDLVTFSGQTGKKENWDQMSEDFKTRLLSMIGQYRSLPGKENEKLRFQSGHRDQQDQERLYQQWVEAGGGPDRPTAAGITTPAKPVSMGGTPSRHNLGEAADFGQQAAAMAQSLDLGALGLQWGGKFRQPDPVHIQMAANGGIFDARPGGHNVVLGEAGESEAVIPLANGRLPVNMSIDTQPLLEALTSIGNEMREQGEKSRMVLEALKNTGADEVTVALLNNMLREQKITNDLTQRLLQNSM